MTDIHDADRDGLGGGLPGLTELASAFAADRASLGSLTLDVVETAKLSIFDWFAVLHAGLSEPVGDVVRAFAAHEQSQGGSTAIGMASPTSARIAAYVNGAVSHALDYDDTHFGMVGHPTVAVFPAVLAVAQELKLGGRELLEAFVIGVETSCRLGSYFGRRHYAAGFHQTATSGSFGAAAGVGRLLGLNTAQMRHALGLASTRASGLRSQFGTMGKPIHAGMAASNGVEAARLASYGCISRPDAIECVEGFASTHASGGTDGIAGYEPDARFQFPDVQYKFHACCHGTHGPLEAVLQAKDRLVGGADAVGGVVLTINPQWTNICCIPRPKTGLEVKFSLAAVVAMALLGVDTSSPASFTDSLCSDPAIVALADKVTIEFDASIPDTVTLAAINPLAGERIEVTYDLMGPVPREVIAEKLRRKAAALLGRPHAERLWRFVDSLDSLGSESLAVALVEELAAPSPG